MHAAMWVTDIVIVQIVIVPAAAAGPRDPHLHYHEENVPRRLADLAGLYIDLAEKRQVELILHIPGLAGESELPCPVGID